MTTKFRLFIDVCNSAALHSLPLRIVRVLQGYFVKKVGVWRAKRKYQIRRRLLRPLAFMHSRLGMRSVSPVLLSVVFSISDSWQILGNSQPLSPRDIGRQHNGLTLSRDNEYILSGYRPASYSFRKSYASLGYIHNETSILQPDLDASSSLNAC